MATQLHEYFGLPGRGAVDLGEKTRNLRRGDFVIALGYLLSGIIDCCDIGIYVAN